MTLLLRCPHCEAENTVDATRAGQLSSCGACGKAFTIPRSQLVVAPLVAQTVEAVPIRRRSGWSGMAIVLAGVGGLCLVGFVVVGIIAALLPSLANVRDTQRTIMCEFNLITLNDAIESYVDENGNLPAAYTVDPQGAPACSWRGTLLEKLGFASIYEQIDFGQPWNHAANEGLRDSVVASYRCPSDLTEPQMTSYAGIVGETLVLRPGGESTTMAVAKKDGAQNTLLLVELRDSDIVWLAPRDLDLTAAKESLNTSGQLGVGSPHVDGFHVLFLDGRTDMLARDVDPDTFEALITPAGGELVDAYEVGLDVEEVENFEVIE
ncbi:MAG: DUF1559 domain-containing protein [Planctomycetota bacterium]|nr:MAG: DUF1559 domain-containing protein [Planctomycetota bacterium]REJ92730.1 MAG: DUF1559 domain-containing protein [Planctomycetota bacterium]